MTKEVIGTKIDTFSKYLQDDKKMKSTIKKYVREANQFFMWQETIGVDSENLTKGDITNYSLYLKDNNKCINTCNGKIFIINKYLESIGRTDIKGTMFEKTEEEFIENNRYIDRNDYFILYDATDDMEMKCMLYTFAGTGIRVSELKYATYEAIMNEVILIENKGRIRKVPIVHRLKMKLWDYCKSKGIKSGSIFLSNRGTPYKRCTIWKKLKDLAKKAGVLDTKVFPHALRHLFAVEHYKKNNDIEGLARVLGHKSTKTTLIYLKKTVEEYAKTMDIWDDDIRQKKCSV